MRSNLVLYHGCIVPLDLFTHLDSLSGGVPLLIGLK